MNPLSGLHGAMGRERKPFTYTPGGIDLSQIKSERMAKRLMRNAMDQGVPEHPTTNIQSSPSTLSTSFNVPNYNCLPVQVFPTFPLPTNPKSLLKTRTNVVDQKDRQLSQTGAVRSQDEESTSNKLFNPKSSCADDKKHNFSNLESRYENKNNEKIFPTYAYNVAPIVHSYPSYGSSNNTEPILQTDMGNSSHLKDLGRPLNAEKYENVQDYNDVLDHLPVITNKSGGSMPLLAYYNSEKNSPQKLDTSMETDNKQKEVKVVKKQTKSENVTEGHNGDTDVQAAVTVKLPGKKSSAKTETKVEVVKNVLPDGSVEEVKTTTTKTTKDGKTEITTKTETTIIPKEDDYEEEEVIEEEEEEEEEEEHEENTVQSSEKAEEMVQAQESVTDQKESEVDNEDEDESVENITKQEERSDSSVVKKVTIVQSTSQESSEEELEQEENEEKQEEKQNDQEEVLCQSKIEHSESKEVLINGGAESDEDQDEQDQEEIDEAQNETKKENDEDKEEAPDTEVESEKDEVDEAVEVIKEENDRVPVEHKKEEKPDQSEEMEEETENQDDNESQEDLSKEQTINNEIEHGDSNEKLQEESPESIQENKEEVIIEVQVLKPDIATEVKGPNILSNEAKKPLQTECHVPLREPSVPLEKVEDVEIKPIGHIISKSHTENTEIITSSLDKPTTGLSTQTAYNRIENIVTVNRTTKTLDHAYEQISQHNVPMVKTSFVPNLENLSSLPQLSRPYQPVYPPEPQPERRHSLLLDRLSVDRQMPPTDSCQSNYQLTNQNYEVNQWSQEPQSEVLTVSNVKPSTITKNQQWYQQTKKEDISYTTPTPTLNVPSQQWNPQQVQSQQQYLQPQPQVNYQPQPQYQPTYVETQDSFKNTSNTSSTYQQSSFPTYTPKPMSWVNSNFMPRNTATPTINKPLNQFSSTEKEKTETFLTPTQQFSSSYVPPPWEQDSQGFVTDDIKLSYYPPSATNNVSNNAPTKWTPTPTSKFSKPKPTSYIPPAPNQSFVKPVTTMDPPRLPGRKTYYSEYERRYISVPESTYIPTENKFQAQPDPSPQYYYDNNEPTEIAEPEWRKELREFSEKSQTQGEPESLVKPPWEEDQKYYVPKVTTEYNPTPTWSQTLRPNTWRERSFESEFVRSKELPRTNTLGRGRPQSTYVKSNVSAPIPERPRGVSVDRYNSNTYMSPVPSEYPPVVSHTLDPSIGSKTYHNPNVPAYHSRASAEPREQSAAIPQARHWVDSRAPPIQSRSFKYLQWITGTED